MNEKNEKFIYDNLSDLVDITLTNHENIATLTSHSDFGIIHSQVKYFNVFLINSVEEEDPEIILNILPWMYHAFNSQGFKYEYFLLLYEVWENSISNILDQPKNDKFQNILNQLKNNHQDTIDKSEHYTTHTEPIPDKYEEIKEEFMEYLLHADKEKAKEMFNDQVKCYKDLQCFYKYIIYPSMFDIGTAWEKGLITPAHEHLATTIVLNILSKVYVTLPIPKMDKKKIIVATTTNEFHEIGALMLTSAFQLQGWDVEYFGTNITEDDLLSSISRFKPFIVALSVSMPFNLKTTKELISKIREIDKDIKIMVGGNAFKSKSICKDKCGADIYLKNIDDALNEAELWLESENEQT